MADISTLRTSEDIDFIKQAFGESYYDIKTYEDLRAAQVLSATRAANVELLAKFDAFCRLHGIKYFAYGKTLRGVVSYADFLPGDAELELGILRADYDRLVGACRRLTDEEIEELGWRFDTTFAKKRYRDIDAIYPRVTALEPTPVLYDGKVVFDGSSLPMQVRGSFELPVFEEVPDDFFTRKKFFRQMKRRNTIMKRAMNARELMIDDEGVTRFQHGARLRYRFLPLRFASWLMHHRARKYAGRGMSNVTRVAGWRSVTVPITDFGEMQRLPFAGIQIYCPIRPDIWAKEPIIETTPELRRLQEDAKEIVAEIDRICQKLGIQYFACGGTMLGYVRHGGFIPWDDDIDIGMMRADYERFKAEAGVLLDGERFFLQTRETDPNIPYLFSKVRMNGTTYITDYNKFRDFHKGICVDVFPFDYIPNDPSEQRAFRGRVKAAARAHNRIVNRQYPKAQSASVGAKKNIDWLISQINGRLLAHHYWSLSLDETQRHFDEVAETYNDQAIEEGLQYVACFVPSYTMAKVSDLYPAQRVSFDGLDIMLPNNPEVFLRMQYGNFMVLPYPHQRAGHDLLLWSDEEGVGGGREAEELAAEEADE